MVSKRGLSDIVSNVLIILLVLVAVGILWLFLKPTIGRAGNVGEASDCYSVDVKPTSCKVNGTSYEVVVERSATGPKALQAINFVFGYSDKTSKVLNNTDAAGNVPPVAPLGSSKYKFTLVAIPGVNVTEVTVGGVIVSSSQAGGLACPSSTVKVACA